MKLKATLYRSSAALVIALGLVTYAQAQTETFTLKSSVTYGEEGIFFNTNQGKVALNMYSMPSTVTNSLHKYNLNKGACIQVVSSQGFLHENGGGGSGIQSISNCTTTTAAKTATIPFVPAKSRFTIFNNPNVVSLGRCHMDECSWSKSVTTRVIQQTANETSLKITLLGGTSGNPDDSGSKSKMPKINWDKTPHELTLRCSYQSPTISMGSQSDVLPLNASGVSGVLESAANLYFEYCHSDTKSGIDEAIRKYGYHVPATQE